MDYVVYANDNKTLYRVDGLFDFRGFVGVYSLDAEGVPIQSYVNDGDVIGEDAYAVTELTGTVTDFTRELAMENEIRVRADQAVEPEELVGRYIQVANDGKENGCYRIESARSDGGELALDIGSISPVRSYRDNKDFSKGYVYNIGEGQRFRIPLSHLNDNAPVFEPVEDRSFIAGKEGTVTVSAESPLGLALTYSAKALPRGAHFDEATRTVKWTPDRTQIGSHHVAIQASDGARTAACHFNIQVFNPANGSGGSADQQPLPPVIDDDKDDDNVDPPEPRFTDMGGYAWAQDAVERLAADGIVQGTGPDTYSPGKPVTRADFAILMVRAFDLTGEAAENFADVAPDAYYAREVSIAKQNGILKGVGGNRVNPTGAITRQDLCVMLARTLAKTGYALEEADAEALAAFRDAAQIADYAQDAAALLAANGIVAGDGGYFRPLNNANRAEVAVLLDRLLNAE